MSEKSITNFFENDLPAYASYDNLRKLCSSIDGLKISMRKIIFTMLEKYPGKEKIKTDTVANITAAYTNYIHGSANLCGVCDTLAQSFVGANNYSLLEGNSSGFGTRINPTCAASRYTKIVISPLLDVLLNKNDLAIVEKQFFEGSYIEPKYFIPTFPILFLNGSHGLSTGFSQDIYPRDPKKIIEYIKHKLDNKTYKCNLLPWFRGFKGTVRVNSETGKTECLGNIVKNNMTSYTITEIPIGIDYQKYIEILDNLCDKNIIVDYQDLCDTKTDNILFEIKTTREFTKQYESENDLYSVLKLVKTLPETLCCIDENNRVKEYNTIIEILDDFIDIRLRYYDIRKNYILDQMKRKLDVLESKYIFCNSIISGDLVISNVKKVDIIKKLEDIKNIIKVDDSYNYLLNMPIHSISHDTLTSLQKEIKEQKAYYKEVKAKTIKEMWLEDLDKVELALKNYDKG